MKFSWKHSQLGIILSGFRSWIRIFPQNWEFFLEFRDLRISEDFETLLLSSTVCGCRWTYAQSHRRWVRNISDHWNYTRWWRAICGILIIVIIHNFSGHILMYFQNFENFENFWKILSTYKKSAVGDPLPLKKSGNLAANTRKPTVNWHKSCAVSSRFGGGSHGICVGGTEPGGPTEEGSEGFLADDFSQQEEILGICFKIPCFVTTGQGGIWIIIASDY